jgi:hypothetical protein
LPLVLHILDVKLSSYNKGTTSVVSNPQEAVKQHRLNILIEAMKTYQPQYDGVDYVSETIRHIVTLAQLDTPAPPSIANPINDWQDILASQPGSYLRLAMTMDLSLSKGRLPEESDFPASLRGLFTAGYSSVKALMDAGKTTLAPLPQHASFISPTDQMFLPMTIPVELGIVHSLSPDTETGSPRSSDDQFAVERASANSNLAPQIDQDECMQMAEHSFVDAALDMEDLAGEALAARAMQSDSPQTSSSYTDVEGAVHDDEATMTDWIDQAWADELDSAAAVKGDHETAQALLEALQEGEGIVVQCGG